MQSRWLATVLTLWCVGATACERASTEVETELLAITISTSNSTVAAGTIASFTLSNESGIAISVGECGRALERRVPAGWETATAVDGCYLLVRTVVPGGQAILQYYIAGDLPTGTYRLRDSVFGANDRPQLVYSPAFSIVKQ